MDIKYLGLCKSGRFPSIDQGPVGQQESVLAGAQDKLPQRPGVIHRLSAYQTFPLRLLVTFCFWRLVLRANCPFQIVRAADCLD